MPESTIADLEKEDDETDEQEEDEAFRGVVALVQGGELQRPIGVSAFLSGSNSESESQGEHREALTPLFFDPIHMGIDWVPAEAEYRPEDVEILGPASSTPWDPTQYFANSRNDELASAELRGPPIVYCQFRGQRVEIPSTSFSIAKATYGTALCNVSNHSCTSSRCPSLFSFHFRDMTNSAVVDCSDARSLLQHRAVMPRGRKKRRP